MHMALTSHDLCIAQSHTMHILVVTPVQGVDVSSFMTAYFISSCKLLVCLGNCYEGLHDIASFEQQHVPDINFFLI